MILAQLFKVLDLAHEATLSGVPATKRQVPDLDSIYERNVVFDISSAIFIIETSHFSEGRTLSTRSV